MAGKRKARDKANKRSTRFNAAARKVFLTHLAESANVSASARAAGVATSAVYAERQKSPEFCALWTSALAEGYAQLEAMLLAEALTLATGNIKESTLKARAQKHRLAQSLLAAHKASVKDSEARSTGKGGAAKSKEMRAELIARLNLMRERTRCNSAK